MERVHLIINTFFKLLKLEHHRNFSELCNAVNIVPVGLRIKKSSSCVGEESREFGEMWRGILAVAESQLVALLICTIVNDCKKQRRRYMGLFVEKDVS